MPQYKRYNATKLAERYNTSNYYLFDIFRQTTLERLVNNNPQMTAQKIKHDLLTMCAILLEECVRED